MKNQNEINKILDIIKKQYPSLFRDDNIRDPKRIKKLLKMIKRIWKKYPNLRLMQLLGNCFGSGDNYYKEDDELGEKLVRTYPDVFNLK